MEMSAGRKDAGRTLDAEEKRAIRSLRRLAKNWPETLWLFSCSGGLLVMQKRNGERVYQENNSVDPDYIVASILGIDNDGGDF